MLDEKVAARRARGRASAESTETFGKADATRQSIVEAAARIFRRDGYSSARLTDIAAEIGKKAGSLYYHFDSREALLPLVTRNQIAAGPELYGVLLGAIG